VSCRYRLASRSLAKSTIRIHMTRQLRSFGESRSICAMRRFASRLTSGSVPYLLFIQLGVCLQFKGSNLADGTWYVPATLRPRHRRSGGTNASPGNSSYLESITSQANSSESTCAIRSATCLQAGEVRGFPSKFFRVDASRLPSNRDGTR
jgi:hypothetical protein